jgi:CheY-like chemotaxis protein
VNLAILDVVMPEMRGRAAFDAVRDRALEARAA